MRQRHAFFYVFILSVALISLRRPDQFGFPEVWNEDGLFIIPQLINDGMLGIFTPVNGYIPLPFKLISWVSLKLSFVHYAEISTYIGILAQALCVAIIAVAPTFLRGRIVCALTILVLPMDPEVYVLPQYVFWWTTLFVFLALIWLPFRAYYLRLLLLVIGGLSSPTIIVLLPVFALRALFMRFCLREVLVFLTAFFVSALQSYLLLTSHQAGTQALDFDVVNSAIRVFLGSATVFRSPDAQLIVGYCIVAFLLSGLIYLRGDERFSYGALGLALGAVIFSSVSRAPLDLISPVGNGPRYFFLPFVIISWMFVWLACSRRGYLMCVSIVFVACAPITLREFQRGQDRLESWSEASVKCLAGGYDMPVHHDGSYGTYHAVQYSQSTCSSANRQSLWRVDE